MLERYLFLKNQRALRQRACAIKREKLDVERKYRIFARSPVSRKWVCWILFVSMFFKPNIKFKLKIFFVVF